MASGTVLGISELLNLSATSTFWKLDLASKCCCFSSTGTPGVNLAFDTCFRALGSRLQLHIYNTHDQTAIANSGDITA